MGTVFPYKGRWRFKFKDAAGEWRTVTSKARTKAEARSELHEKELEVERQNLGLAPRAINPERWTIADLMRWWLDTYSRHQAAHGSNEGTVRCHILGAPIAAKLLEHVQPGDVEQLLQSKEGQLSPGTINHIRQFFGGGVPVLRRARAGPAAGLRGGHLHRVPQGRAVRAAEGRRRPSPDYSRMPARRAGGARRAGMMGG